MIQLNNGSNNVTSFKERVIETNRKLNGFSACLMLLVTLFDLYLGSAGKHLGYGTMRIIFLGILQLACFLLARKINYKIISFLTIFGFYFNFLIFPLLPIIIVNEELTLLVLITSLPIVIIPTLLYHIVLDKKFIFGWFAIILITVIYDIIVLPDELILNSIHSLSKVFFHYPMIKVAHVGALFFLFFVMYYNRLSNHNYRKGIIETNVLLQTNIRKSVAQSFKLEDQKESLDSAHEEINQLNKRLEKKVMLRTHKLNKRNEELIKYAFMNSHILKAPIARLKGLLTLSQLSIDETEKKHFSKLIGEEVENLDQASRSINAVMEKRDRNKIIEIQKRVSQIYGEA